MLVGEFYINNFSSRSDKSQTRKILSVLEIISSKTCVKFKHLSTNFTELSYVNVTSQNKCSSNVGYREGIVEMSLNTKVRMNLDFCFHSLIEILSGMSRYWKNSPRIFTHSRFLSHAHNS